MILKTDNKAEVLNAGIEDTINMTIDDSDKAVLMAILSEGLYSDSIGSLIREYSTNALDSHIEAGNKEPIIVSLKENSEGIYEFSVEDFGVGLSPDRVHNIFSKYASSSKRSSLREYGMYGLGSKSGLSYCDSFIIISTYNGVRYTYTMYKGEDGTKLSLLNEVESNDRNGVKIIVPLKDNDDHKVFVSKIKEQLAYFEDVYFEVIDRWGDSAIDNKFQIIKHEDWKYSEINSYNEMHLCLDNVAYPIDWNKLGINSINTPVALNFSVRDGITPTPNREQVIMNTFTKQLILDKIKKVATYFITKYNQSIVNKKNIIDIWDDLRAYSKSVEIENRTFIIDDLIKYSEVPIQQPSITGISKLDLDRIDIGYLLTGFNCKGQIYNNKYKSNDSFSIWDALYKGRKVILANEAISKVKMDFIKDTIGDSYFVSYKQVKLPLKIKSGACYYNRLRLYDFPKEEWRQRIQEYQLLEKQIVDTLIKIEDIEPTKEWLEQRKNNRKRASVVKVEKVEINPKYALPAKAGVYNCKFIADIPINIDNLPSDRLYIYDTIDNRSKLDDIFVLGEKNSLISPVVLVNRDIERLKNKQIKNWISYKEFMEGKLEIFGKYCTAFAIQSLIYGNRLEFSNKEFIAEMDIDVKIRMDKVQDYKKELKVNSFPYELIEEMTQICIEKDLWDKEIYDEYLQLKEELKNFEFIKYLKRDGSYSNNLDMQSLPLAKQIYNFNKQEVYENQ